MDEADHLGRPLYIQAECTDDTGRVLARAASGEFRIEVMSAVSRANAGWLFKVRWPPVGGWPEGKAPEPEPGPFEPDPAMDQPGELPDWA